TTRHYPPYRNSGRTTRREAYETAVYLPFRPGRALLRRRRPDFLALFERAGGTEGRCWTAARIAAAGEGHRSVSHIVECSGPDCAGGRGARVWHTAALFPARCVEVRRGVPGAVG